MTKKTIIFAYLSVIFVIFMQPEKASWFSKKNTKVSYSKHQGVLVITPRCLIKNHKVFSLKT